MSNDSISANAEHEMMQHSIQSIATVLCALDGDALNRFIERIDRSQSLGPVAREIKEHARAIRYARCEILRVGGLKPSAEVQLQQECDESLARAATVGAGLTNEHGAMTGKAFGIADEARALGGGQ